MGNKIPFPSAILFDFDGVVVNSFKVHSTAWKKAFEKIFNKKIPDFPTKTHAGKAPILIAEYFCNAVGQVHLAQNLYDLKAELLHKSLQAPELLPGIKEMTSFLKENGIQYGIASNATKQFIKNSIVQLDLNFETYTGVEDYTNPKPHPEAYLKLAEKLEVSREFIKKTWVFEDSITGIKAAKDAGMIPVGILTQQAEKDLIKAGSQIQFPTVKEGFYYLSKLKKQ